MSDAQAPVQPQLTQEELATIRRLIKEEERMTWLWYTVRKTAVWVATVVGALVVMWDQLVRFIRSIAGAP